MSTEDFLKKLELPVNADIGTVEAKFLEVVKERLHEVAQTFNEETIQEEEKWLRGAFNEYFKYSLDWAQKKAIEHKDIKNHPSAEKLKKEAKQILMDLHKFIIEFASCYMHINHFMALLRDEIKQEEHVVVKSGEKKIKWTSDAGAVIARYKKQKNLILRNNKRMQDAQDTLEKIETYLEQIGETLLTLFGKDKADKFNRSLTASLRVCNFAKAQKVLAEIEKEKKKFSLDGKTAAQCQAKIKAMGNELVTLVESNKEMLQSDEDKLFLKRIETDLAASNQVGELKKIKTFLRKYHLPYMEYKMDSLGLLKDKLLVLGSLDSLMMLYLKMIIGIVKPMPDIKDFREFEGEVLGNAKYLTQGHFKDIPVVLERSKETVQEFRQSKQELEELNRIKLEELETAKSAGQASG